MWSSWLKNVDWHSTTFVPVKPTKVIKIGPANRDLGGVQEGTRYMMSVDVLPICHFMSYKKLN